MGQLANRAYHFIGIGGIGMSGLAKIALSRGATVTGSDLSSAAELADLKSKGAEIFSFHREENIRPEMHVIYTSALSHDNVEIAAAQKYGCPLLHRSQLLVHLIADKQLLAVTGVHGKTTTAALLAYVLHVAGADPTYTIGAIVPQLDGNAREGKGRYFVAEADESDGSFLRYFPRGAIVTNIDTDHMEFFHTEEALVAAFAQFVGQVSDSSLLFWCGDDQRLAHCCGKRGVSYGTNDSCQLRIVAWHQQRWHSSFSFIWGGKSYSDIFLPLTGMHNALNAAAVFGLALSLGVDEATIRSALAAFGGVKRRCERRGELLRIALIDDYAHHPTAVEATLRAIRAATVERRLLVLFQPHRYSRTRDTLGLWAQAFDAADAVFIMPIYSAWEQPCEISHEAIVAEVAHRGLVSCTAVDRSSAAALLHRLARPHDVIVTMGAGDVTDVGDELLHLWQVQPPAPLSVGVVSGGCSGEHDVALQSLQHILQGLNQQQYRLHFFGITKRGNWVAGDRAYALLRGERIEEPKARFDAEILHSLEACEVLFPVLHGPYGEDGTIQGFFELLGKPYIGCDQRAAALCMDKGLIKRLAQAHSIPTLPFIECSAATWYQERDQVCRQVVARLAFPVFIKPVHLGSSLGVKKVDEQGQLSRSIDDAFRYDSLLIIEQGAVEGRELEFALFGNEVVTVFPPGEVLTQGRVYDYEAKYGPQPFATSCSALGLTYEQLAVGMRYAEAIYRAARCNGLARVDFFFDSKGFWWLNEVNPLPGFTQNSLYPKMCQGGGVEITSLIDTFVALAMHRHSVRQRHTFQGE